MIIGNPKPMPAATQEWLGISYDGTLVNVSLGDKYICCSFTNCRFRGEGPVEFRNCDFVNCLGGHKAIDNGHYICCDFRGKRGKL
jgi:hypothetical protein